MALLATSRSLTSSRCMWRVSPRSDKIGALAGRRTLNALALEDAMANWIAFPDETPSKQAVALAEQIERDGGHALAIYREPVGDHWQIFCLLPMERLNRRPTSAISPLPTSNAY